MQVDPLNIMLNLDQVVPYYEPIISADTQHIVGYEVKAYFQDNNIEDLDWFFYDSSIPEDFQIELIHHIQKKAMETVIQLEEHPMIFLKYNSRLLIHDNGSSFLYLVDLYKEHGIETKNITIQLKEEELAGKNIDDVSSFLKYLKTTGIQIALDIGQSNGNLDRIAVLKPNIIKVDVRFLDDNDLPHLYRDVHHSLSLLSRKIGATLLFKGISSYNQLNYAWRNGGRYFQGSYLRKAEPRLQEMDCCKEQLKTDFQLFVNYERKKIKAQLTFMSKLNEKFNNIVPSINPKDSLDEIILKIGNECTEYAFRVYITNDEGIQQSSNAEKIEDGNWVLRPEGKQKNWSWRPYFFEGIIRMNVEKKGILSDLYTDIDRNEPIRTYSIPLQNNLYLFIDIPYHYLFEKEGLL